MFILKSLSVVRLFAAGFIVSIFSLSLHAADFLKEFPSKSFHQLKSGGQVIGKTEASWRTTDGQLVFSEKSTMKIKLFAEDQILETAMTVTTGPDLRLIGFEYQMNSADSQLGVNGLRKADRLQLEKMQAGRVQRKEIPVQEPLLLSPMIRPFVMKEGLPTQKAAELRRSAYLLEPSALTILPMTIVVKMHPRKPKVWNLQVSYLSHQLESEIGPKAELLQETTDMAGLQIVAEPVAELGFQTMGLQGTKNDLVEQAKVAFPKIQEARTRDSLQVKIKGIPLHEFQLSRHRQKLDGQILTIKRESFPPESKPIQAIVGRKDLEPYLAGDISMPVFDPVIQKKAREIVKDESDLWKRAKAIHDFVFNHLKKDPYVSLPDALEALESGRGDCNEHAVLYTSLARAAGVPTRMVVGLVYSDIFYGNGKPGFYYHAWVEVFTGSQWLSIDPTWNQIPSDATHIAFVEGGADKQIQIASIMGKIQLEGSGDLVAR